MRMDAKIGIVVGIVIALGVIAYIFFTDAGDKPAASSDAVQAKRPADKSAEPKAGQETIVSFGRGGGESKEPAKKGEPAAALRPAGETPAAEKAGEIVTVSPPGGAVAEGPRPVGMVRPEAEVAVKVAPAGGVPPSGTSAALVIPTAGTDGKAPAPAATAYTVQDHDTLWSIAAKAYKDGSKYPLIVKANPDCDKGPLRPGRKLTIPALPGAGQATVAGLTTTAPSVPSPSAGAAEADVYVVQEGDWGFWVIAQKRYGDGNKFYLIQNANPNVDSKRLRVGMKLHVPRLSDVQAIEANKAEAKGLSDSASAGKAPSSAAKSSRASAAPSDGRPRFLEMPS